MTEGGGSAELGLKIELLWLSPQSIEKIRKIKAPKGQLINT